MIDLSFSRFDRFSVARSIRPVLLVDICVRSNEHVFSLCTTIESKIQSQLAPVLRTRRAQLSAIDVGRQLLDVLPHRLLASLLLTRDKLRHRAKDGATRGAIVTTVRDVTMRVDAAIDQAPGAERAATSTARQRKAILKVDKRLTAARTLQRQQLFDNVLAMRIDVLDSFRCFQLLFLC